MDVFFIVIVSLITTHYAACDVFNIVTSTTSSCPGECSGEPCLTLQQYASYPSNSANVTLILESRTHKLERLETLIVSSNTEHFTIIAPEMAYIILTHDSSLYLEYYYYYNQRVKLHFSGISFIGKAGGYHLISIERALEIIIENCSFQGIMLRMYNNWNFTILRSCFSNYNGHSTIIYSSYSNSILISECVFSNNTSNSYILYISGNTVTVAINATTFINNTAQHYHGIVHLSGTGVSVLINTSTFINNRVFGHGGVLQITQKNDESDISIVNSTFILNSAENGNCGVFSISDASLNLRDSTFYYNRAYTDGGVACIWDASVSVSDCTFIGNTANGIGGAIISDNSTVLVRSSLFRKNTAGYDGGAMSIYAYMSNYIIEESSFIDNSAGDDGGAIYVGRAGSLLRIDTSTFSDNRASDRGGAIAIFGSTMNMTSTNIYNNMADLGKAISACYSEVITFFNHTQSDASCRNYDTNIDSYDILLVEEQSKPSIIQLGKDAICSKLPKEDNTIHSKLQKASAAAYTALTVSITSVIGLLLYVVVTKIVQQIKNQTRAARQDTDHEPPPENQPEPVYDVAQAITASDNIEMVPNVVYGTQDTRTPDNWVYRVEREEVWLVT